MRILIIGAGRLGMHVIRFLSSNDENHLTIIEKNRNSCRQVSNKFDAVILNADVTKPGILEEAHPSQVDLLLAATDNDLTNISLVHRAKMEYGVPRIVAVANSSKSKEQMREAGADVVVSPVDLALKDLENVFSLKHSTTIMYRPDLELEVTEMTVPGDGSMMGKKLSDIKIPDKCRIVLVSRESGYIFPDQDLELKPGDRLLILGDAVSVHNTVELLTSTETA